MQLTLALAQCAHREDGDALALVADWAARAAGQGAQLLVFPECLMTPYEKEPAEFAASAQPADGPFARGVAAIAAQHGLWVAFTMNEADPAGGRPFNSALVVDAGGQVRLHYRKVHLFDAGSYRESAKMQAGPKIAPPIETPWGKLGMGVCYDLRFCEFARVQALAGCELLLYPAAWVAGPRKVEQWRTLLSARAVENGMFVAGLSRCGGVYAAHSAVYAPDGRALALAGAGEELLVATLDLDEVAQARAAVPVLQHRRPELY